MATKPDIFQYSNYREFLKDHFKQSRADNKGYSYRYFGTKAGFSSPNFLYLIIKGERNLTKEYLPKFANALKLTKKEQQYFENLVAFNQAKSPESKRYYLEQLHNFLNTKTGKTLNTQQLDFISKWHYSAIWEMVSLPQFEENPAWIRKHLRNKISISEINNAITKMLSMGFLTRDEKNRLVRTEKDLTTDEEVYHTAAYSFHQQMLSLAKEAIAETSGDNREVTGVTMAVSENQFKEIKRMVRDFKNNIVRYVSNSSDIPEKVYHVNLSLFPLSENKSKNRKLNK